MLTDVERVLDALARLSPVSVDPGDELARALVTLGSPVPAGTLVDAGYGAGTVVAALGLVLVAILPGAGPLAGVLVLVVAAATVQLVHEAPGHLAIARRTRATAAASALVGRATLRMRVAPSAEAAATFAATGDDPLAADLRRHVRRARGTPRTGFESFAAEWETWSPSLARAVRSVVSAAELPEADRERTLARARETVRDGLRDRARREAAALRAPVAAVYAFGVVLPLALVGVLPAAGAAGVPVSPAWLALALDVALPVGLLWTAARLLARRPVAFPPPQLSRTHPDVPDRRRDALVAGAAVVTGTVLLVPIVLPGWTRWPAAVGAGAGTVLTVLYRPTRAVRQRVRSVEADLPDALALVGRRVADGTAVERAIETAAGETGAAGNVLETAARRQRVLGAGVAEAFLGDHGALATVPSPRARDAARFLALAAREGRPVGEAVVTLAAHLDDLREVEREARADLARVTTTLSHTGAVVAPLVGGVTVALFDRLAGDTALAAPPLGTAALGSVVAVYVLALAVVLPALATGLDRGLDRALLGERIGRALLAATATFLLALLVATATT